MTASRALTALGEVITDMSRAICAAIGNADLTFHGDGLTFSYLLGLHSYVMNNDLDQEQLEALLAVILLYQPRLEEVLIASHHLGYVSRLHQTIESLKVSIAAKPKFRRVTWTS